MRWPKQRLTYDAAHVFLGRTVTLADAISAYCVVPNLEADVVYDIASDAPEELDQVDDSARGGSQARAQLSDLGLHRWRSS